LDGIELSQLPDVLSALGAELEDDSPHAALALIVLSLALKNGKAAELRKVIVDHFLLPNITFFNNERAIELRKYMKVIK
jgi:hypothetical protein